MENIKLLNVPSGHDGNGYVTLNGERLHAFRFSKLSAQVDIKKEGRRFLGEKMTQNAPRGMSGSGDMAYYHISSQFIEAMKNYKENGDYPEITVQYYMQKPSGRCEVALRGVVLDSVDFGALDDGSDNSIICQSKFSFDDFDLIEKF